MSFRKNEAKKKDWNKANLVSKIKHNFLRESWCFENTISLCYCCFFLHFHRFYFTTNDNSLVPWKFIFHVQRIFFFSKQQIDKFFSVALYLPISLCLFLYNIFIWNTIVHFTYHNCLLYFLRHPRPSSFNFIATRKNINSNLRFTNINYITVQNHLFISHRDFH